MREAVSSQRSAIRKDHEMDEEERNMSKLDEKKSAFEQKLSEKIQAHTTRLETELQDLRKALLQEVKPVLPEEVARGLAAADNRLQARRQEPQVLHGLRPSRQGLVKMGGYDELRTLDYYFRESFNLPSYFPEDRLNYPTFYCETLEEFISPMLADLDISPQARDEEFRRAVKEAEMLADESDGHSGKFGVNLPGLGCFINGWLFGKKYHLSPKEAWKNERAHYDILGTTAHEKLGHGFLSAYSEMGKVKTSLGLHLVEVAHNFGLRPADDPVSRLRQEQAALLFQVSQLLEEGWATWVEGFLVGATRGEAQDQNRYTLQAVSQAVEKLPIYLPECRKDYEALLWALVITFGQESQSLGNLHHAAMIFETIGGMLDEYFGSVLGQPLRYAVGNFLFSMSDANLGTACLPYAALIAANVTLDPAKISLTDLYTLFERDPRLHPDARMAALSRLQLSQPGSVTELARRTEAELSFSVPLELKRD